MSLTIRSYDLNRSKLFGTKLLFKIHSLCPLHPKQMGQVTGSPNVRDRGKLRPVRRQNWNLLELLLDAFEVTAVGVVIPLVFARVRAFVRNQQSGTKLS